MKCVYPFAFVLLFASSAQAQQSPLIGKYRGAFETPTSAGRPITLSTDIEIASAENGRIKGTTTIWARGSCGGTFPIEGTYEGNKLQFVVTEGSKVRGCDPAQFNMVAEGNRLAGKVLWNGWVDLKVSK